MSQSGQYKQYADAMSLQANISLDVQHGDDEADYSNTSSDGTAASENIADEKETEEERPHVEARAGGTPFSSLPCFFCQDDALEPEVNAHGSAAFVFGRNQSFGYTCQRCKDRTWISAMEYTLTLFGGAWAWKSS